MSRTRRVARNTAVQVAGEAVSKVASLALYVVMARELGRAGFGDFTFASSLVVLTTVFGNFGVDTVITRSIARERGQAGRLLVDGVSVKATFGGLGAVLAVAVAAVGDYDDGVRLAVVLLAVSAVVDMVARVHFASFQGLDDMRPPSIALLLQRAFTAATGIVLLTVVGAGLVAVAAVWLGGALIALAYIHVRLRRAGVRPRGRPSARRVRALVTSSFAIGLAGIFGVVLFRVDVTLLSLLDGNEAVGLYGAAYRLLESTLFLSFAFVASLLPSLSRLDRTTTPSVAEVFELGCKVLAVALLPLGAGIVAFAAPVMDLLYGPEYAPAIGTARILGAAVFLYGLSYLSGYVLISQERQNVLPWVVGGLALFNIGLNLVLIPPLSHDGAAIATTAAEAAHAAILGGLAMRATGRLRLARIVAGPAAGVAAIAAVALLLGDGLAAIVLAAVAYCGVLYAVERRAWPSDLQLVLGTLTRRRAPEVPAGPGA